jgi:hypothetical protein
MAVIGAVGAEAEPGQGVPWVSGGADSASIDAWLLAVLEDEGLRQQVRQLKKVELVTVWQLTRSFLLLRHSTVCASPDPLEVHRRLIAGLAG